MEVVATWLILRLSPENSQDKAIRKVLSSSECIVRHPETRSALQSSFGHQLPANQLKADQGRLSRLYTVFDLLTAIVRELPQGFHSRSNRLVFRRLPSPTPPVRLPYFPNCRPRYRLLSAQRYS